ncbi:phosphate transport system permease protein [Gracilimonas mengyeensis]|uniref:Phosphate transport system permease protein PstA n=2 Tax=Gracilimonas mengyeensis TaxID=1302730 RepID=A0A521ET98_9BACT|nr:phosphate transport system permease protein [Gracilimonas mengyeensis]
MNRKSLEEQFFRRLTQLTTVLLFVVLTWIIATILYRGIPAMSWDMITKVPQGGFYFGKEGGVLNAIIGSFYLAGGATLCAIFVSLPVALFMNIHLVKYQSFLTRIRLLLDILWGVPAIVYGAFGFTLMLYFGLRASLLAGIITVAIMICPIMIRAMDEVLRTIPRGLMEASYSLGSTRTETAFKIYARKALPGLTTAVLLALGKGIGDAAAVLFTAGFTDYIPENLLQPTATLPLSIFFQLSSPIEAVRERAYAAAIILTVIILLFSLTGRGISTLYKKYSANGND